MSDHQVTLLSAALSTGGPILAVLIGILVNNRQLDSLRREIEARFNALEKVMHAKFDAVDARFNAAHEQLLRVEGVLDARLKHLEENAR